MSVSVCHQCGKTLASPAGLRRHINSQHQQNEYHKCECGRRFLDPAGRSRCRAGHSRSFGCLAPDCSYRSNRKDAVKQHIRRRHPGLTEYQVVTLPPRLGFLGPPSSDEPGANSSPPPRPVTPNPIALRPNLNVAKMWSSRAALYDAVAPSQLWNFCNQPGGHDLLPTIASSPPFLHIASVPHGSHSREP